MGGRVNRRVTYIIEQRIKVLLAMPAEDISIVTIAKRLRVSPIAVGKVNKKFQIRTEHSKAWT